MLAVQKSNTSKETKKQVVFFVGNRGVTFFTSKASLYLCTLKILLPTATVLKAEHSGSCLSYLCFIFVLLCLYV